MNKNVNYAIVILVAFISCYYLISRTTDKRDEKITNINIYKDTPVWKLALAVRDEKSKIIEKIARNEPQLLNFQEPKYGTTLLLWAIGMEKYSSVEALLKCGADPNIPTTIDGKTPLFLAAGYSWVDNDAKKDARYVKLLLSYGANPNQNYTGGDKSDNILEPGKSPLMESIGCGIEKTKALIEGGADINYKTPTGKTAAIIALRTGGPNATLEGMEYAYYLIVEKKAKVSEPYFKLNIQENVDSNEKLYPVNLLRNWVYNLSSEQYRIKMEIIREFEQQGINYWDTKIPNITIEQIKKVYPDTWEEYLKRY